MIGCDHTAPPLRYPPPDEGAPVRCKRCGHQGSAYPLAEGHYYIQWQIEFDTDDELTTRIG